MMTNEERDEAKFVLDGMMEENPHATDAQMALALGEMRLVVTEDEALDFVEEYKLCR